MQNTVIGDGRGVRTGDGAGHGGGTTSEGAAASARAAPSKCRVFTGLTRSMHRMPARGDGDGVRMYEGSGHGDGTIEGRAAAATCAEAAKTAVIEAATHAMEMSVDFIVDSFRVADRPLRSDGGECARGRLRASDVAPTRAL
jgi:hypothetical protein